MTVLTDEQLGALLKVAVAVKPFDREKFVRLMSEEFARLDSEPCRESEKQVMQNPPCGAAGFAKSSAAFG